MPVGLVAAGGGFGNRLKLAIMTGCIPIVIQDNVHVRSYGLELHA